MAYTEPAYAKLNLTLDILGRRDDGYHDMRMVMQSIDLQDLVSVSLQEEPGLTLTTNLPYLPRDGSNIAIKAATQFFRDTGLPLPGLSIDIQKNIPVCAGMAGGSSDGAAVLRLLRQLCLPELPQGQLEETGGRVGSDIPYCVRGGTALAEGRGEILTSLPPCPPAGSLCASPSAPSLHRSCSHRCASNACAATQTPLVCWRPSPAGIWMASPTGYTTFLKTSSPGAMPKSLKSKPPC